MSLYKPYEHVVRIINTLQVILGGEKGVLSLLICVLMGGCFCTLYIYIDFKNFLSEQTRNQAAQTELLRNIDQRLVNLERARQ